MGDKKRKHRHFTFEDALEMRVDGDFRLADVDASATPGLPSNGDGKEIAADLFDDHDEELAELQEKMFAWSRSEAENGGPDPRVILVLQGMDTAGKGGVIRHVLSGIDPQGVHVRAFGRPTEEEKDRHFLYRGEIRMPPAGRIGVWDRSHYEAVLVEKVKMITPAEEIEGRYDEIVEWEDRLADENVRFIKVMLHMSREEQYARLEARLDRPEKHWKFDVGDIEDRTLWDAYQQAYDEALRRTSTEKNPWYCVPADHKWYARLVVKGLLLETLRGLDLDWPGATFDVDEARRRLEATR